MSDSSQRTRSSSRHLNVALQKQEPLTVDKADLHRLPYHSFTSWNEILHPPSNQLLYQSRDQIFYRSTTFGSRKTFQTCTNCTWKPSCPEYSSLWRKFSSATLPPLRNRPERLPSNNPMSDDEDSDRDETPHGIQELTLPLLLSLQLLTCLTIQTCIMNSTTFALTAIQCCGKKNGSTDCCNNDKYTIPALKPVPPELMSTFRSTEFQRAQRWYNGLCSFTALGAGGVDKRRWTQPNRGLWRFIDYQLDYRPSQRWLGR